MSAQVEYTTEELLLTDPDLEPLVLGGVRCHGGLDDDGDYVSPRTRFRAPAIEAWEAQRVRQFGTPILDAPLDTWPESFPNVEQSRFLLRVGAPRTMISRLTRIGTVEGFGGMLRFLPIPDWQACFEEDVRGTATAHIGTGLFEAHARDEAGHEDEAGHDRMWYLARDLAFDHPTTEDETAFMLERMGITPPASRPTPEAAIAARASRVLPDDIDLALEIVIRRMIGLLFIEISAFHSFRWAEAVLSDAEVVAGDGGPARIVSYIRADETPHVSYLRTALSEMRDRTWVGRAGARYRGSEMMPLVWDRALQESAVVRRGETLQLEMREIEHALAGRPDRDDVIEELLSLGTVRRLSDGTLVDPDDPRYPGDGA
jgi:hypothetical protein